MKLYFLRHGSAADRETWESEDELRPLTKEGEKELARTARRLAKLDFKVDEILSSPYLRAAKSAEILAFGLGMASPPRCDRRLEPGFDIAELRRILAERAKNDSLLLVGHEPDFGRVVSLLAGGVEIQLGKGGLARVDLDSGAERGKLIWLLTSRLLS